MHYYKKNLGDYYKKAGRLSILEHGAYTLLIDACYDRERFPTESEAIEWCWASTEVEIQAVKFILSRFFVLNGDIYEQPRIMEELERYHKNAKINKRIAQEREDKRRKESTDRARNVNEATPNHKPLTKNQEPKSRGKSKFSPPSLSDVKAYCSERKNTVDPNSFINFYESKGWMIGKNKMKCWKSAVRTWEKRDNNNNSNEPYGSNAI